MEKRQQERNVTHAPVGCRPFQALRGIRVVEGIMHNYSSGGSYVESPLAYSTGSVLVVRILQYPSAAVRQTVAEGVPSIGLAEVKWVRQLGDENQSRYGFGLKYLQ